MTRAKSRAICNACYRSRRAARIAVAHSCLDDDSKTCGVIPNIESYSGCDEVCAIERGEREAMLSEECLLLGERLGKMARSHPLGRHGAKRLGRFHQGASLRFLHLSRLQHRPDWKPSCSICTPFVIQAVYISFNCQEPLIGCVVLLHSLTSTYFTALTSKAITPTVHLRSLEHVQ